MIERFTTKQLSRRKTKSVGQESDLKVEKDGYRVWLSRCGLADGTPFENTVYVERLVDGAWQLVDFYDGDNPS